MNQTQPIVWPERPYPLGATWDGEGVNFALFSEHAEKVELYLYDASGRRNFFQGRSIRSAGIKDILWFSPDGREMTDDEWKQEHARSLGVCLAGPGLEEHDERGQPLLDDNFLLLMNAHHEQISFVLPAPSSGASWIPLVDTSCQTKTDPAAFYEVNASYRLQARSLALLTARSAERLRATDRRA